MEEPCSLLDELLALPGAELDWLLTLLTLEDDAGSLVAVDELLLETILLDKLELLDCALEELARLELLACELCDSLLADDELTLLELD